MPHWREQDFISGSIFQPQRAGAALARGVQGPSLQQDDPGDLRKSGDFFSALRAGGRERSGK